jgi:transcriptional regulator with XRE-family HTH domain
MLTTPGGTLRRIRERLTLKYRDVEEASQRIAAVHRNQEFVIGLSRLADIEHKGTVPSIFRLYSLATIYGLNISELLEMYGVSLASMAADQAELKLQVTKPVSLYSPKQDSGEAPLHILTTLDSRKTAILSRQMQTGDRLPFQLLESAHHRYAIVGTDDWSMYPLIPPGACVQVDQNKRRVASGGWESYSSRPIYFLELREGYRFGWCTETPGSLIV